MEEKEANKEKARTGEGSQTECVGNTKMDRLSVRVIYNILSNQGFSYLEAHLALFVRRMIQLRLHKPHW